jgi:UDP-glucose 4-epimerase
MTVLVTGGAGYIGSHTTLALLESGYDVVVVDNFCNSHPEALRRVEKLAGRGLSVHRCDLREHAVLEEIFRQHRIDAVIHFAALKAVGESVAKPLEYYANNLGALTGLLDAMREAGCFRMIFSSSATVYSTTSEPPFPEDAPLGATNPYGRTKLFSEEILRDLEKSDDRWKVILLRYFNPVGAHPSGMIGDAPQGIPNNLFPYVTQVAVGTLPELAVFGNDYPTPDGTGVRDYIHVCDLSEGHVAALRAIDRVGGTDAINLGTGKGCSVLDVVRSFEAVINRRIPYRVAPRRPGDVAVSLANPARALAVLGWRTRRELDDMCRDAWRWQEQNPRGYA